MKPSGGLSPVRAMFLILVPEMNSNSECLKMRKSRERGRIIQSETEFSYRTLRVVLRSVVKFACSVNKVSGQRTEGSGQ